MVRRLPWLLSFLLACGCAGGRRHAPVPPTTPSASTSASTQNERARSVLCSDVGEDACLQACQAETSHSAHVECLLSLRFESDPEALRLARAFYRGTSTLVGADIPRILDGYGGEPIEIFPALPLGEHRHHLAWLHSSLVAFDDFFDALDARASKAIAFERRPNAFVFFRTAEPSYPSEYFANGMIGYNLEGPLHNDPREMHETLFHELFHLNDARRNGWSVTALGPVFDAIIETCADGHACLGDFAPHDTLVPEGTYYAFDPRTRDVVEYAAELALRYFLEHEAILAGTAPKLPPFKCGTAQNRRAWDLLVDEFFGGVDLTPRCDAPEVMDSLSERGS